jgi:magnesium chelatase family protein
MALARTHSVALAGVEGHPVAIEADIANGLVGLQLVGLPDASLREARDRIRAAIINSREAWPQRRITVGLSPASLPKRGSSFDLGIAVAILAASGAVPVRMLDEAVFLGELGLDGRLHPVRGVLPSVAAAAAAGFGEVMVPSANAPEAALVPGMRVIAAPSLQTALGWIRGDRSATGPDTAQMFDVGAAVAMHPATADPGTADPGTADPGTADPGTADPGTADPGSTGPGSADPVAAHPIAVGGGHWRPVAALCISAADRRASAADRRISVADRRASVADRRISVADRRPSAADRRPSVADRRPSLDLADVLGQPLARRAAEICAAGGHHLMLLGPPGTGKTMLAERIPTIMPPLEPAAALEVTSIHSIAGTLPPGSPLISEPPFCGPHHTATKAAIVGGGSGVIHPGAASLAHMGILLLDEAPEFDRDVLDALRQPLESGQVVIARSGLTARFPARFTLVLAANPCPCARAGGPRGACTCTPMARRRYLGRLSGPLLDRVDVKVEVLPVSRAELLSDGRSAESSSVVAGRVAAARERAAHRLAGSSWRLNAEIPGSELRRRFAPAHGALGPLERAMELGEISARGVDRVLRVSWTLADLAGRPRPGAEEICYALGLWLGAGI